MPINEMQAAKIRLCLTDFKQDLLGEIIRYGDIKHFQPGDYVVRQEEPVRYLPVVLDGCVKVLNHEDEVQFLLYYVYPASTCIFSFANLYAEDKPVFSAIAEEQAEILLIPSFKALEWQLKYPAFNNMILREYQRHYNDLLETTRQVVYHGLEARLLTYLQQKAVLAKSSLLAISHQSIAVDFATSREVITRVLKKIEKEGKLAQEGRKIRILF